MVLTKFLLTVYVFNKTTIRGTKPFTLFSFHTCGKFYALLWSVNLKHGSLLTDKWPPEIKVCVSAASVGSHMGQPSVYLLHIINLLWWDTEIIQSQTNGYKTKTIAGNCIIVSCINLLHLANVEYNTKISKTIGQSQKQKCYKTFSSSKEADINVSSTHFTS